MRPTLTQIMSPTPASSRRPQSGHARSSWTRRRFSSADPNYDDAALEDMLHQANRAQAITLYEKTCLSVCRRLCPKEPDYLLGKERRDLLSVGVRIHRLEVCCTDRKIILAECPMLGRAESVPKFFQTKATRVWMMRVKESSFAPRQ